MERPKSPSTLPQAAKSPLIVNPAPAPVNNDPALAPFNSNHILGILLLEQSKHASTYTQVVKMLAQHQGNAPAREDNPDTKLEYERKSAKLFSQLVEADKRKQQADALVQGHLTTGPRQQAATVPQPQQGGQAKWTRQPAEKDRPILRRTPSTTPADCERFLTQFQLHCSTEPFPFKENGAIRWYPYMAKCMKPPPETVDQQWLLSKAEEGTPFIQFKALFVKRFGKNSSAPAKANQIRNLRQKRATVGDFADEFCTMAAAAEGLTTDQVKSSQMLASMFFAGLKPELAQAMASDSRYIKASEQLQGLINLAETMAREQQAKESALRALSGAGNDGSDPSKRKRGRDQDRGGNDGSDPSKKRKRERRRQQGSNNDAGRQKDSLDACKRCKKIHGPRGSPEKNCWADKDADGNAIQSPPTADMPDRMKKAMARSAAGAKPQSGTANKATTKSVTKAVIKALAFKKKGNNATVADSSASDSETDS